LAIPDMVKRSIEEEVILYWDKVPVFYCPVCGKKIADWWWRGSESRIEPCRHLLFVYFWNTDEFLYIREDVAERLKQQGIELEKTNTGVEVRSEVDDILVLLKPLLKGINFAVFTLYSETLPQAETFVVSVGVEFVDESGYDYLAQEIGNLISIEALDRLRGLVFGGSPPRNASEILRRALEWVSEKVYVDKCDDESVWDVNEPLSVVEEGRGSCWDAAVLLTSILLSAGVEPVYIVDFDTSTGRNVVVAVEVDGDLFVLDREPKKWSDFFSNVSPLYDLRVFKVLREKDHTYLEYCRIDRDRIIGKQCNPLYMCR